MSGLSEKARLVADRYEAAYFRANGQTISVRMTGSGWYGFHRPGDRSYFSASRHRLSEIEEMAKGLEARADEQETAAKRIGYVVKIEPPREREFHHMTTRYRSDDATGWTADRKCATLTVFETSREADEVAHEVNKNLPFAYAAIERF